MYVKLQTFFSCTVCIDSYGFASCVSVAVCTVLIMHYLDVL